MARVEGTVIIENANIIFRNFSGKEGMYNKAGERDFCVILDPDVAEEMDRDGWNIKTLKEREEGVPGSPYVNVNVSFKGRPPTIFMITSRGRTAVTEDIVDLLDFVEFKTADLILNPYNWDVNGNKGVKAYLKSLYVTIEEDYLDLKYSDVPDAQQPHE